MELVHVIRYVMEKRIDNKSQRDSWYQSVRRTVVIRTIIAAILISGTMQSARAELTKVKAGHLVALDMAPLFVGKESGCFEKYGLDVETVFFANPGDNNAALAGGAIDFSTNPFTLPFFAANSGVPIRVIAAAGGWGVMEVIAQKKLGFHSMADLKPYIKGTGKPKLKIATLQGDTLELILIREFAKLGIPVTAVEFVYFNDLLAMVEAFRGEQVDLLSHIKPYTTDMVASKGATVLTSNAKTWSPGTPNTVVSVLEKTLQKRPNVVESYLKGLICAAKIINQTPQKAVEYLTKGTYYRVSPNVLLNSFKSAPYPISFTPDLASIQSVVSDLTKLGYVKGNTTTADIFRIDMIKALEK